MLTKTKLNPGEPVLIVEDCRDGSPATGLTATYEGDLPRSVIVVINNMDEFREYDYEQFVSGAIRTIEDILPLCQIIPFWQVRPEQVSPIEGGPVVTGSDPEFCWFPRTNPKFKLPDGSFIWGDECWWKPAGEGPENPGQSLEALEQQKEFMAWLAKLISEGKVGVPGPERVTGSEEPDGRE